MAETLRVLFATSEAHPLVKTGGLADVSGALPAALRRMGLDVRLLLPGYSAVLRATEFTPVSDELRLLPHLAPVRLLEGRMPDSDTPVYVLDCPVLYHRDGGPYVGPGGADWPDNAVRFGALSLAGALLASQASPLAWRPALVHCNDWQTGLVPAYLALRGGPRPPTVMSVHNLAFAGTFPPAVMPGLGLPWESFGMHGVEYYGQLSFLKAGLYYADHVTTVSPTYAREIQTPEYGCGFQGLLAARAEHLTGILNGIDTTQWDPAKDPHLVRNYDARRLGAKAANKSALQQRLGLDAVSSAPLVGLVGRLTHQKGIDLLPAVLAEAATRDLQFALLGSGDKALEADLRALAHAMPGRASVTLGYDETLAHQIEAGADLFLMPSRFEPCGLNQMYSMRYGTPPLVRRTGGLADSVVDTVAETLTDGSATGFVFDEPDAAALAACLERASALYTGQPAKWRKLQRIGMARDFSWAGSAARYAEIYERLLGEAAR